MKDEKGYEILDAESVCKEHEKEKQERLMRVQGYGMMYEDDKENDEIKGFIPRNNVRDRL